MKALSLMQPWASLVPARIKWLETRSWQTSYRGPLAIHASARFPKPARLEAETVPFRWALRFCPSPLPLGMVLCTVNLRAIYPVEMFGGEQGQFEFHFDGGREVAGQFPFGNFSAGRFIWHFDNIRPLKAPVPAKGALGLWEWNEKGHLA